MKATDPAHAVDVWIGVGANLDRPLDRVREAIAACGAIRATRLVAQSSLYASAPIESSGDDYINAVLQLRSALAPLDLLDALQAIEAGHGRARPYRNAPRTLDLDLLLYGEQVIDLPRLAVPHPRMHQRAFVLHPLLEIAPAVRIPGLGAAADLLAGLADQRVERLSGRPPG